MEVAGLTHRWPDGTVGLAGVDLAVARGERVAVLGPNGSGKSTLALHLVGALGGADGSVATGSVRVAGLPVGPRAALAEVRRRVGLVFQDPDDQILLPTVVADVGFAPASRGVPAEEVASRVAAALDVVGLTDAAERAPEHLSLGERRRVALAGVLAAHPEVLVLDEPTANLDPAARRDLVEVIRGLDLTTVVVTHDLPLALELCPRAVVLAHGRVAADGPTEALFANPGLLAAHRLELPYRMTPTVRSGVTAALVRARADRAVATSAPPPGPAAAGAAPPPPAPLVSGRVQLGGGGGPRSSWSRGCRSGAPAAAPARRARRTAAGP